MAGVISERPGIALGEAGAGKVLVATTGRVKVRADAKVVAELNGAGALQRRFVYAEDDEPLATDENGRVRWYYRDPINSKLATAGPSGGELLGKVEFDPAGVKVDDDWAVYSNFRAHPNFNSQEFYERVFGRPATPAPSRLTLAGVEESTGGRAEAAGLARLSEACATTPGACATR